MYKTLTIFALLFAAAVASHYRYGTMYFVPIGTRQIRLSIDQAWRGTAFGNPNIGTFFYPGGVDFGDFTSTTVELTVVCL